jgi:hypothetical protein
MQAYYIMLIDSWTPTEITGSTTDGEITYSSLGSQIDPNPLDDWAINSWIMVNSMATDTGVLLAVVTSTGTLEFTWTSAGVITFQHGSSSNTPSTTPPSRPVDQWFFVIAGSYNGQSFGVVTLRDTTGQYSVTWAEGYSLDSTIVVRAPVGAGTFTVVST